MAKIEGKGTSEDLPDLIRDQMFANGLNPERVVAWEMTQRPVRPGDEAVRVDIKLRLAPESPEEVKLETIVDNDVVNELERWRSE